VSEGDAPGSSVALPVATAVEVEVHRAPNAFTHGIFVGYAVAATLAAVWVAIELAPARRMYADLLGGPRQDWDLYMPESFRRAWWFLSAPWLWGVPTVGALASALLIWRRPRRVWPYIALALALTAAVVGTWWFANEPLRAAADNIVE
jgi:hypothetical protein